MDLGLTEAQKANRHSFIGGSDANIILGGDPARIHDLWCRKTGRPSELQAELDGKLFVVMGHQTEPLNRDWFRKIYQRDIWDAGASMIHPDIRYMAATLDGMTHAADGSIAVFEAKHTSDFTKRDDLLARYMPQLHHNMLVTNTEYAVLSIFRGNGVNDPFVIEVPFDQTYGDALLEAEALFWSHVEMDEPPDGFAAVAAPVSPDEMRVVDMTGNNQWADLAADYIKTKAGAELNAAAQKTLKAMVPDDASRCFGHGVSFNRASNGALRIKIEE